MKLIQTLALVLTLSLLTGCGMFGPKRDINDPKNSLVFGYMDMADAPTDMDWATIQQVSPHSDEPYWGMGVDDGLFQSAYLPPGSYIFAAFGGKGFIKGEYQYDFPRQNNQFKLRLKKPGIYYIGSFKYKEVKTGFFEAGKFDIVPLAHPTEAELLQRMLKDDELSKSAWGKKIRARLAQLKK